MLTLPTPRSLKTLAWLARIALGTVAVAWLVFGISWASLHWLIVPRITQWQPDIERLASQRLGVNVRIGTIQLDGSTAVPSFTLTQVDLLDDAQQPIVSLPRVKAALSVSSIWRLGFEQLIIDRPVVDLRRNLNGEWLLGGWRVPKDASNSDHNAILNWVMGQPELAILGGTLRYTDERLPQSEPLVFQDIRWVNRRQDQSLQIRLDARLPHGWGDTLTVQGAFKQPFWKSRADQWRPWTGTWFVDAPALDLQHLSQYLDTTSLLGFQWLEGTGATRVWADMLDGQLRKITLDMGLSTAAIQWPGQAGPMALNDLSGRLHLDRDLQSIQVATENLSFRTMEGVVWPGGNFLYSQTLDADLTLKQMRFESDDLDALALFQLSRHLPIDSKWLATLVQSSPEGRIAQLNVAWDRLHGGEAWIQLENASINTRDWFSEPRMGFDQLEGRLHWKTQDTLHIEVNDLRLKNKDLEAQVSLVWAQDAAGSTHPGHLKLDAKIHRAQAQRVYRYLPKTLGAPVLRYLQTSLKGGTATQGRFLVDGNLANFPFTQQPGLFEVSAQINNVLFDYAPAYLLPASSAGWPDLLIQSAQLRIGAQAIEIQDAQAQVAEMPKLELPRIQAKISDYTNRQATVHVKGPVQGPASEVIRFIQVSALDRLLNGALSAASASGPVSGQLALHIPIQNTQDTTVTGQVVLNKNTLRLGSNIPTLLQTRGLLNFDESSFSAREVQAQVLGGDAMIDASLNGRGAQQTLSIQAQGVITAQGLTQEPTLEAFSPLTQKLQGQTDYQLDWTQQGGVTRLTVESRLQGLASFLPLPFQKAPAETLPLRIEIAPVPNIRTLRDEVSVLLGPSNKPWLSARYQREPRQGQMQIVRGSLGIHSRAPSLPASGVLADIRLDSIQMDEWSSILDVQTQDHDYSPWMPTTLALQARRLQVGSNTVQQLQLRANRVRNQWNAQVQSQEVQGRINWTPGNERLPGLLQARLSRLYLQNDTGDEIANLIRQDPVNVPTLDVIADDFQLDRRSFGKLEMQANNRSMMQGLRSASHEWRLQQLKLTTPEARFQASGNWAPSQQEPNKRRTALSVQLEIDDAGLLLARFGMPGVIRNGRGKLEGHLGWIGSPLNFNKTSLAGELELQLDRGQFLKAEPGVARLIGVLNLQSLPRRLALDFRDVFSEGFAFDFVRGNVQVTQGIARTNNLQMKGVTAAVFIEGEADVLRETQDLNAIIIPDLSTGTASLVTTLINPVSGISAFFGQALLRQPLQEAGTRQFHVTGTWAEPQITPVKRFNLPQNDGAHSNSPHVSPR